MDKKLEARIERLEKMLRNESIYDGVDFNAVRLELDSMLACLKRLNNLTMYCDDRALQNSLSAIKEEIDNANFVLKRIITQQCEMM